MSEEDDTELVCVGINGVPPGGLGCDIIVDFNLTSSPRSVARKQKFFSSNENSMPVVDPCTGEYLFVPQEKMKTTTL